MTGENTEAQQQPSPLATERERLRQAGYAEAEISQIMVARAVGGGASRPDALPPGMLSSVLGSIVAVGGYVAGLFTAIPQDVATILDVSSKPSARSGAFVSLLFKVVVIGVLGFAAWQEWQQHIIWQTQIAAEQAQKLKAEADAATALNEAQVRKLEAEAAVAKQLNDAQAQKLRAEADAAKALNDAQVKKLESEAAVAKELNEAQTRKTHAEECSARMKAAIDTMPMDKLMNGGTDSIQRDCDPAYAAHAKACDEKFKTVVTTIETLDFKDKTPVETIKTAIGNYKDECTVTEAQQEEAKAAFQRRDEKIAKLKSIIASLPSPQKGESPPAVEPAPLATEKPAPSAEAPTAPPKVVAEATSTLPPTTLSDSEAWTTVDSFQGRIAHARNQGQYDIALQAGQEWAAWQEQEDRLRLGKPGPDTAVSLVSLSHDNILIRRYGDAADAATRASEIDPTNLYAEAFTAHAWLLGGDVDKAKQVYLRHKGQKLWTGGLWEHSISDNFAEFRKAGISDPNMDEMDRLLHNGNPG